MDCCSRVDEDVDRAGLPYCNKSGWWFGWLLLKYWRGGQWFGGEQICCCDRIVPRAIWSKSFRWRMKSWGFRYCCCSSAVCRIRRDCEDEVGFEA
jgi:hypothetical protein